MALFEIKNLKSKGIIRWLVEVLILAVLIWIFFILAGRALCHIALAQIAGLTNTEISTESVNFHTDGSVIIKQLEVRPYEKNINDDTIIKAETVYARFSLGSLFLLHPRLKVIDVNDFVFNAQYDLDTGWWNLSALTIKPPKGASGKMPRVLLREGTLQYTKISNGKEEVAVSVPLNARFGFDEQTQKGYGFEITTATLFHGYGKSRLTGFWKPGYVEITGGISSVDVPELEMAWIIEVLAAELKYDTDNNFSLKLRIDDLHSRRSPSLDKLLLVGPAFLEKSGPFTAVQKFFNQYRPFGKVDIDLDASGNFNQLSKSKLSGKVDCKDVAFCYYKFPYIVEHLTGRINFTKNSVVLKNLRGKHGDVELFFNGWSRDFGPDWKYQIRVTSNNIALDNDLYSVLNAKQKKSWSVFSPTGFAEIEYQFERNSQTEREEKLTIEPRGAEAAYKHFPYPLKNLTGRLFFENGNVIFSDLVSQVNDCKLTINGRMVTNIEGKSEYDILVDMNNVPLDTALERALPQEQRVLYNRIQPAGLADGLIQISGRDSEPAFVKADLSFKDASLKSDRFSLPVTDISAKAVFTPDMISVSNFTGKYGDGSVSLIGQIWPGRRNRQSRYELSLNFERVQFNDDLFSFVPESLKEVVNELKPKGKLNLAVDLTRENLDGPTDYRIKMDCLGDSANLPHLPCPLKDITGTLLITKDVISSKDVSATLDDTVSSTSEPSTIELSGQITLAGNSFNDALLHLSAKNVFLDECFIASLPEHIQPIYSEISPTGRFDLDFKELRILSTDDGQKSVDFTGNVGFHNCSFNFSEADTELDAVLFIKGSYNTIDGLRNCRAAFDDGTLRIHGKSFTNLKADIFYDHGLRLWSTTDLIADHYGGKAIGKFELKQPEGEPSEYLLQVVFDNIDLQQFLADTKDKEITENRYTTGRMDGSLSINARVGDTSSRLGVCRLTMRDMQVGKLSPVGKILQVLKMNESKDYAFDQMFLDSYIRRDDLIVKKLDLSGQTVAFYGSGRMDLKTRNLDLDLTARGRRLATDDPSILQSLTEGLGRAVIKMEVTGNFEDPDVKTRTLPVIGETLKILGTKPDTR